MVLISVCALWLALFTPAPGPQQENPPAAQAQDQFFSGTVTAIDAAKITVNRTVLGKNSEDKTFAITPETRMEGKPRVKSRVTVRFVSSEDGDRAIHIIVRSAAQNRK